MTNPWDFFGSLEKELSPFFTSISPSESAKTPDCDVTESEDKFLLSFDVPGINTEDLDIKLEGNTLTISGERKSNVETNEKNVYRLERKFGKFQRSFSLPEGTDQESIEASYANGVLEIFIAKPKKIQPRKIEIKSEAPKSIKIED